MLYGVLSNTTNLGPAVALDAVLVVSASSLEKGLISTSSTGNNTNLSTDTRGNSLLTSRGETKTGGSLIIIVGNNDGETPRSTGKSTTITDLGLNVAHNSSLGNTVQRQAVSNNQVGLLTAVDELTSVHTLGGNHKLGVALVLVGIQELNLSNGGTSARVVDDLLDDSTDVTMTLSVVEGAKLHGALTGAHVSLEDGRLTLPLCL
mmetsp:Transcript_15901/g.24749  ORF Transcript_15901/g.24749 Transcript_15901/m.24749 type:complete len:205 (+) Transcript_15901:269-883(+)